MPRKPYGKDVGSLNQKEKKHKNKERKKRKKREMLTTMHCKSCHVLYFKTSGGNSNLPDLHTDPNPTQVYSNESRPGQ